MVAFFRELPFQIQIQGQLSLFYFAAGYAKAVDPQSGMTVNLKDVNSWLEALRRHCQGKDFTNPCEMLRAAHSFLKILAANLGASLTRVQVQFENQNLLSQNEDEKFEFQRSGWVTDSSQIQRVQIIATFSVLAWSDVERLQKLPLGESFRACPEDLFQSFPVKPLFIEVRNPLTGSSILCLV